MRNIPLYVPTDINKYFYDREGYLNKISYYLKGLNENVSPQLLITGYRGVGKTFLLHKIIKDLSSEFLITYVDISRIFSEDDGKLTSTSVLLEILDKINDTLLNENNNNTFIKTTKKIQNLINSIRLKNYEFNTSASILDIPIPTVENDYKKLSKFVMDFPQKIVDTTEGINGFIIIFDEIQLLKKLENPEAFFWLIRSHNQFQDNVSYIMTGSTSKTSEIVEMINGETGAFGGRMIQININPFTKDETRKYFDDRMPEIVFDDSGFSKFYEYTRGIPAYINSFANVLSSGVIYNNDLIEETFILNIDQILVMWIKVWGTLNSYEKKFIILMVEHDDCSWEFFTSNTSYSKATISKYLDSLQNKGIVEYHKPYYSVEDKMLKTWLEYEKNLKGTYPQ